MRSILEFQCPLAEYVLTFLEFAAFWLALARWWQSYGYMGF